MTSFGLLFNVLLWTVPAVLGLNALPRVVLSHDLVTLSHILDQSTVKTASPPPGMIDGLVQLIGVESEGLQIAAEGLQEPTPADLGPRANLASTLVVDAADAYVRAAASALDRAGYAGR